MWINRRRKEKTVEKTAKTGFRFFVHPMFSLSFFYLFIFLRRRRKMLLKSLWKRFIFAQKCLRFLSFSHWTAITLSFSSFVLNGDFSKQPPLPLTNIIAYRAQNSCTFFKGTNKRQKERSNCALKICTQMEIESVLLKDYHLKDKSCVFSNGERAEKRKHTIMIIVLLLLLPRCCRHSFSSGMREARSVASIT